MFIELVDALRCPRTHEESWLVLATSRIEARHIREGMLGCPVCRAEYPIRDGIVDLRLDRSEPSPARDGEAASGTRIADFVPAEHLAAMLNLGDALGFALLIGDWGRHADAMLELDQVPPLMLVDPPAGVVMRPGVSGIRADARLPLAVGAARAAAVDDVDALRLASTVQVTRPAGRLVGPAQATVPDGVRELVRDERVWVGEREAPPSEFVRLHVRRG
jgi:uncharacterized protein YbaR (Trm112 family)